MFHINELIWSFHWPYGSHSIDEKTEARQDNSIIQGPTASKRQRWCLNPGILTSGNCTLNYHTIVVNVKKPFVLISISTHRLGGGPKGQILIRTNDKIALCISLEGSKKDGYNHDKTHQLDIKLSIHKTNVFFSHGAPESQGLSTWEYLK